LRYHAISCFLANASCTLSYVPSLSNIPTGGRRRSSSGHSWPNRGEEKISVPYCAPDYWSHQKNESVLEHVEDSGAFGMDMMVDWSLCQVRRQLTNAKWQSDHWTFIKGSLGGETSVLRTFRMSGKELVKERVSQGKVS
jgi:hypothetical protein